MSTLSVIVKFLKTQMQVDLPDVVPPTTPESRCLVAVKDKLLPMFAEDVDVKDLVEQFAKITVHDIDHKPELRAQLHDALLDIADLIHAEVKPHDKPDQTTTS